MQIAAFITGVSLVGLFAAAALSDPPNTITGHARVVDGDSLTIGPDRIRLHGIDSPEMGQMCSHRGFVSSSMNWIPAGDYDCGAVAKAVLVKLIDGREVTCRRDDVDHYGRIIATCGAGATHLNAEMVRAGFAVAYRRYSSAYVIEEEDARREHRGIWAGDFVNPEQYRREHPRGR